MSKSKYLIILGIIGVTIGIYWLFNKGEGGKIFGLSLSEKVETLDPAQAFDNYSLTLTSQIYEPLYEYHYLKRPYEVIPLLAEDLPILKNNGKTMRIRLKKGIYYHNHIAFKGKKREVKAIDFVNQFKRLAFKPLKSPASVFFGKTLLGFKEFSETVGDSWVEMLKKDFKGVRLVDDYTLDIHFTQNEVHGLHYLTMPFIVPIPKEVIEYEQNNLKNITVGTGPFFMTQKSHAKFVLKQFLDYRSAKYPLVGDRFANIQKLLRDYLLNIPFLDKIVIYHLANEDEAWDSFFQGKLDMIIIPEKYRETLIAENNDILKKIDGIQAQLRHIPSLSMRWLSFNMNHKVWGAKKKLRQAIAHGINLEAYSEFVLNRSKLVANSIYNPGILGYKPSKRNPYYYSLEKAKSLLKEAGYEGGKGLPKLHFYSRSNKVHHKKMAEFIKEELAKIGIEVVVHIQSFRDYLTKARSKNNPMELWLDGWIYDYPDAENILQLLLSSSEPSLNKSRFTNKKLNRLYGKYIKEAEQERRLEYLSQIEKIVEEEVPWIPLSYENNLILIQEKVRNFRWSSIVRNNFKYIDIEK